MSSSRDHRRGRDPSPLSHPRRDERYRRGEDVSRGNKRYHSESRSPPRRSRRSASPSHRRDKREESPLSSPRHPRRRRSRSTVSTRSSDSRDDDKDRKHHRSRDKGRDRDRDDKTTKHRHRRGSHSRERRERKKEKKDKKKKKSAAVTSQWGKYGLINESDMYNKEDEFRAWLIEERMLNRETMSKEQEKKQFAIFVEDYNTATLPHEKYYNMTKYEKRMNQIRNGELLPQSSEYDPSADLAAHSASHKRTTIEHESFLSKEQLASLRKVQMERTEAAKMKVLGLEVKNSMGVRMDGNEFEGMGR